MKNEETGMAPSALTWAVRLMGAIPRVQKEREIVWRTRTGSVLKYCFSVTGKFWLLGHALLFNR